MSTVTQLGFAGSVANATAVGKIISNSHAVAGFNPFPVNAGTLSVVSSSIEDAPGQDGASTIAVAGLRLDSSVHFADVATIVLDGDNPVSSWTNAFRANTAIVVAGSTNVGDIDITIGGTHVLRISAGLGMSEAGHFSLPDNQEARFVKANVQMVAAMGATPSAVVRAFIRSFDGPFVAPAFPIGVSLDIGLQEFRVIGADGPKIPRGSDLKFQITEFVGTTASLTAIIEFNTLKVGTS